MNADDRTLIANAARDLHQHFCERALCHRAQQDTIGMQHEIEMALRVALAVEVTCGLDLEANA